jgi:hypothetical protein
MLRSKNLLVRLVSPWSPYQIRVLSEDERDFQQKSQELPKPLEDFARGLLATTCLSVAFSTSGLASTFTLTFSD